MLLSKGKRVDVIHQVVLPMKGRGSGVPGRNRYQTGVRIQARAPDDQWVLFVVPNPDNGDNAWQFEHKAANPLDFEVDAPSLEASIEPALYDPPKQLLFASNTAELIRAIDWTDNLINVKEIVDVYPDQYGFVLCQLGSPATEFAWKWRGNAPFAFTSTFDSERAPTQHTIIMTNTKRVRWVDPEVDGPVRQVSTAKPGKPPAVAVTLSGHHAIPLDLVGELAKPPSRLVDAANCAVM